MLSLAECQTGEHVVRYPNNRKVETRQKLLASSRAIAKAGGFDATGVDALMGAIGLTGGAYSATC